MPVREGDLKLLRAALERSCVVDMGSYRYAVTSITDSIPRMRPEVLGEVINRIIEIADLDCDVILAPEAMGIPVAVPLSLRAGIPYLVVRKRRYGLPGEIEVGQVTGYSGHAMYINDIERSDRVVLVDDIVSTGGTLRCIMGALRELGTKIVDIIVVLEKGDVRPALERELGVHIKTLLRIEVEGSKIVVTDPLPVMVGTKD